MEPRSIKILVVEDSPVTKEFLVHLLCSDPALQVIGTAQNGTEAVEFLQGNQPDVITMDINMPQMDGFEATRRIMETKPIPVIIVTANTDPKQVAITFQAMEAGALAVLPIPPGIGHPEHKEKALELIQTVKSMSEVKVIRRWPRARNGIAASFPPTAETAGKKKEVQIVAIGASTGGPPVLQIILASLNKDFSAPVLIVQHIATGFVQGFVEWLALSSKLPVQIATHGLAILPGQVYVAPDHFHMLVTPDRNIMLSQSPAEHGLRPAVSPFFRSVAQVFGKNAVGILLTGMGKDGAEELRIIKEAGGTTIAQSAESCVVNGMPGAAVAMQAATHVLPPEKIAAVLTNITRPL